MKILMRADTHVNIEVPGNQPVAKCTFSQVLAAFSVSLGSMVVGFASSYTSPAIVSMTNSTLNPDFEVTKDASSWVGSIMPLSALFGGIAGGPLIEYIGRRNTILFTAFPFIISWLLIGLASNVAMILSGRALSGFCVGVASLSLPVYLGETIQPEVRGSLGLLPTAFGNIGILVSYVVGMYLNWWKLALFGAILPLPFALLMVMIPETPRWYISKGKTKRARRSLQWLRGRSADVSDELTAIEKTHVESERQATQGALTELFKGNNFKPLLISLGLMFFQQMSGINAVIFYTVMIFDAAETSMDANLCTIIVGIVNFASTFLATALIDRLGRKILLYMSSVSMIVSLVVLGAFFYIKNVDPLRAASLGWLPLTAFVVYVLGFSLGFGPIPWLMMGEILPAKIRGSAASVATSFNWTCTFIVTKTFSDVLALLGSAGTFWLFAAICVLGLLFVITWVPETSGRSLEEIERGLTGPIRRMSAVANIKPTPMAC
ncbi:facilitated trehalose transporter Tret1 [Nasonia vitripennis]|uniref:Major facilitator superfamily (MFS) profile domain-containing protein n=1 Tax=Nasonia vitripennis TaxID=7425 RepID=A0A7M7G2E7_NASVI|nr:facilitated trehalose transporter Tret1 [Nasonia vitripennis]